MQGFAVGAALRAGLGLLALLAVLAALALAAPAALAQASAAPADVAADVADVAAAAAAAAAAEPVIVGDGPQADACGSVGVVSGLDPHGANALSVRSGPGLQHARVDVVPSGRLLYLCGRKARWYAVVYASTAEEDCAVSTPIDPAQPYAGPCRQGWVFDAYVTLVGG